METFSLTGANGWQTLSSLLAADATFSGKYLWTWLSIRNTHAANTIIIKVLPGTTAPSVDSGINLTAVGGTYPRAEIPAGNQGIIDGKAVWIKCSAGSTTFDVALVKKAGIN